MDPAWAWGTAQRLTDAQAVKDAQASEDAKANQDKLTGRRWRGRNVDPMTRSRSAPLMTKKSLVVDLDPIEKAISKARSAYKSLDLMGFDNDEEWNLYLEARAYFRLHGTSDDETESLRTHLTHFKKKMLRPPSTKNESAPSVKNEIYAFCARFFGVKA